jgi:uncharacterized tellurite resistance protein B-like protein
MLDKLFQNLRGKPDEVPTEDTLPQATAAVLVEAARADETYTDEERVLIDRMLMRRFSLAETEASNLRSEAEAAQQAANDLYQFTRVIKDRMSREEKIALVEDLWRIVLSDDERDPHEEMVIRRLLGLIHLTDQESAEARRRAETPA